MPALRRVAIQAVFRLPTGCEYSGLNWSRPPLKMAQLSGCSGPVDNWTGYQGFLSVMIASFRA